jgi:hypothetical protein
MTATPTGAPRTHALDNQAFQTSWTLRVVVRGSADGPPLRHQDLGDAELAEARREAWFNGLLRRGRPDVPFEAVDTRLAPVHAESRCVGFVLEARERGSEDRTFHPFTLHYVAPLAHRMAEELVELGALARGDAYAYELEIRPREAPAEPVAGAGGIAITTTTRPPDHARMPLVPLLERARLVGEAASRCFPVVFAESAHEKAEHYARKGAASDPPVETGALLIGRLCACPDSGEMFVVVDDALEVFDAAQQEFALIYTSATWTRVETVLRGLRARPGGDPTRLVGQAHGHNFDLNLQRCDACDAAAVCTTTNVFVSAEDRRFMRAVFAGQPWSLCWIAGTNARDEDVAKLFTMRCGAPAERGYHVAPDRFLEATRENNDAQRPA